MGALRDRFWERPLADLNRAEWEALCDGCGRCCLHKLEDADTGEIEETNVACRLLDCSTARCSDYPNRKAFVPDCLQLTPSLAGKLPWLPETCAYRRRAEGEPLPRWRPSPLWPLPLGAMVMRPLVLWLAAPTAQTVTFCHRCAGTRQLPMRLG